MSGPPLEISLRGPRTLLERMGGVSGLVYANVPSIAYVVVDAGTSAGLVLLGAIRKELIQPTVSGVIGVAGMSALYSGSAEGLVVPGIR